MTTEAKGWPEPTIVLGAWRGSHGRARPRIIRCDGRKHPHALFCGPTGSGKTWLAWYPTLLRSWTHSAVIMDVKGELYEKTSAARSTFSTVIRMAPAEEDSAGYNMLQEIRQGIHAISDAQNTAEMLLFGHEQTHWNDKAKAYLAAVFLFALAFCPPEWKSLAGVRRLMSYNDRLGACMLKNTHPDPIVREYIKAAARELWSNPSDRETGSIVSTAQRFLVVYDDPIMATNTSRSWFAASDLQCADHPVSLYLCFDLTNLERVRPLLQVMVNQIMASLLKHERTDRAGRPKKWKCLWALDELPLLGKVESLEKYLPAKRSYGHRALIGTQGIKQLWNIYGRHTATVQNCRKVVLRQNDVDEAEAISEAIGDVKVERETVSRSADNWGAPRGVTRSVSENWQPAMQASQIMRMPEDQILIFGEEKTIRAWRTPAEYWRHMVALPVASERLDPPFVWHGMAPGRAPLPWAEDEEKPGAVTKLIEAKAQAIGDDSGPPKRKRV